MPDKRGTKKRRLAHLRQGEQWANEAYELLKSVREYLNYGADADKKVAETIRKVLAKRG